MGVPQTTHRKKPDWLKVRAPGGARYVGIKERLRSLDLHTVCEEAQCPNIGECWGGGTATLMLMGDICTRGCRFCAVTTGKPGPLDQREPAHVADVVTQMEIDYVVLTSVNRDDLPDGGAAHFGETISAIHQASPKMLVEALVPDFQGGLDAVDRLVDSRPDVYAHNMETVRRLQRTVRDVRADYEQSLDVLERAKTHAREIGHRMLTKTSLMLGCGESVDELRETMADLRARDVDVVTFGQYLRPSAKHLAVERYVEPAIFDQLRDEALEMGFKYCASGPLVRSSYRAGEYFIQNILKNEEL
jgi:lipoic acid synthetase